MVCPLQSTGNDPMTLGYELVSSPLGTPNLMKTGDPWLLPPQIVERGAYIFFG